MPTAHEVPVALTARYAFADVAALVAQGAGREVLTIRCVAQVQQLCAFGQRLMDMDAEDFGERDAALDANTEHGVADGITSDHVPEDLRIRALACRMPQAAGERPRGALGSLRPAFRLLLEVMSARFRRGEISAVVATAHIASEYSALLVWERVLGHAGDPALMQAAVGGAGSAWGDFDDHGCPHTGPQKSAARHSLVVARENLAAWRSYLDRKHSSTAHALTVCAVGCKRRCSVYSRLAKEQLAVVTKGSALVRLLNDSALVRLRHSAPVGHGFGVPSRSEVLAAWADGRESLIRLDPLIGVDDDFPLPGFAAMITALAGEPMRPDTLLADTAAALQTVLRG